MEYRPKNFNEFANLIHTTKQEVEELREDNEELERENLCLRNQVFELKQRNRRLEIAMKKATAESSDNVNIFNNYSIPQSEKERREEYRKREQAIEDARNEAYLAKLNRANGIGVERK